MRKRGVLEVLGIGHRHFGGADTGDRSVEIVERRLGNPRQDLRDLRAQEDELLNSYSWADKDAGTVRIPISEAMKLVVERGFPVQEPKP